MPPRPRDRRRLTTQPARSQAVVDQELHRPTVQAYLAHGDFDATHIWLDDQGRYAGIIDFGEMRGAGRNESPASNRARRRATQLRNLLAGTPPGSPE